MPRMLNSPRIHTPRRVHADRPIEEEEEPEEDEGEFGDGVDSGRGRGDHHHQQQRPLSPRASQDYDVPFSKGFVRSMARNGSSRFTSGSWGASVREGPAQRGVGNNRVSSQQRLGSAHFDSIGEESFGPSQPQYQHPRGGANTREYNSGRWPEGEQREEDEREREMFSDDNHSVRRESEFAGAGRGGYEYGDERGYSSGWESQSQTGSAHGGGDYQGHGSVSSQQENGYGLFVLMSLAVLMAAGTGTKAVIRHQQARYAHVNACLHALVRNAHTRI